MQLYRISRVVSRVFSMNQHATINVEGHACAILRERARKKRHAARNV